MEWRFDTLYKHFLTDDWKWLKAVAIVESGENPWAIGDGGRAVGLLQMHPDYWADYGDQENGDEWSPVDQVLAFVMFWTRHMQLKHRDRCLVHHYGLKRFTDLAGADPDNYGVRIDKALLTIG